jgi:hypothetical protein
MFSNVCLVSQVYRIKNDITWPQYQKRRQAISEELGNGWVEEKRLFHGSPHVLKIAREGFNSNLAKPSGMFGPGWTLFRISI